MSRRWQDTGAEYTVTTTENGIVVSSETKRKTEEHCEHCDCVIEGRSEEIELWLNYKYTDSEIMGFCSYRCLSEWALTKAPQI